MNARSAAPRNAPVNPASPVASSPATSAAPRVRRAGRPSRSGALTNVVSIASLLVSVPALAWQPPAGGAQPAAADAKPAEAQPSAGQVANAAGTDTSVTATPVFIVDLKGRVGYKTAPGEKITPAKAGAVLREGYEVITGENSAVQIQVGAGQRFTIDRASKVLITEAIAKPGVEKTTLDLPYGRVTFDVTSARLANDVQIQAPDATLAITGTSGGMEVAAGHVTRAFGGSMNRSPIRVRFRGGSSGLITRQEVIDAQHPAAAENAFRDQFVEINDGRARTGDEFKFVIGFQTVYQLIFGNLMDPGAGVPPPITGQFTINLTGSFLAGDGMTTIQRPPVGTIVGSSFVDNNLPFSPGATNADLNATSIGEALARNPTTQETTFLRLEQTGSGANLRALTFDGRSRDFTTVATFNTGAAPLRGLGQIDNTLYTIRQFDGQSVIHEINVGSQTLTPVANFGVHLESIDGITERGTLALGGRLPVDSFLSNGTPGALGADALIMEYDPRNHSIRRAFSDLVPGQFSADNATDITFSSNQSIQFGDVQSAQVVAITPFTQPIGTGAFVTSGTSNFLTVHARAFVNGSPTNYFFGFNPGADPQNAGSPPVFLTGSDFDLRDSTSEVGSRSPGPFTLAAPTSMIDLTLPPLFRTLGYSQQVVDSGVAERLLRNQILQTAIDATAGAMLLSAGQSSQVPLTLAQVLALHVNQVAGFGQAAFDFRNALPMGSPLLSPGFVQMGALSGPTFFFIDDATNQLIERDLLGNDRPFGVTYTPGAQSAFFGLGAAIWGGASGAQRLLLVSETQFDSNSFPSALISQFDLNQTGQSFIPPQPFASFLTVGGGPSASPTDGYLMLGLGTLNTQVYALLSRFGTSAGINDADGIYRITQGETTSSLSASQTAKLMSFPSVQEVSLGLGGVPAHGTLLLGVTLKDLATGSGPPGSGLFSVNSQRAILEVDPRNNLLAAAFTSASGDLSPLLVESGAMTPTVIVQQGGGNPPPLSTITDVVGFAFVGNKIVLSGVTSNNQGVIVTYNPNADNVNTARLERVEFLSQPPSGRVPTELASEPTGGTVPGPISLSGRTQNGTIPTDLDPVFARMAYTTQAVQSGVVRSLIAEHIIARAQNSSGCRASSEIQNNAMLTNGSTLNSIITSHVGQVAGVGQSIIDFRNNLPAMHPCLP